MTSLSTPVTTVQQQHVSIRNFEDRPVDDAMLADILAAGRRAPTSSNMQAYSIIVVKDSAQKAELARLAGGQEHVERAPVFLAFCADTHRLEQATAEHGTTFQPTLESFLIATIDASLVGMSVMTAAESHGLGAVMIGAMRNHPLEVAQVLELPKGVYVPYGMCLGWPEKEQVPPQKPRLPQSLVIHEERYTSQDIPGQVAEHDQALADHYEALGSNAHPQAWSGVMARILSKPLRPDLKQELEKLGFPL